MGGMIKLSEHNIQTAVNKFCQYLPPHVSSLAFGYVQTFPPGLNKRGRQTVVTRMRENGFKDSFPDYWILAPFTKEGTTYRGLLLELKTYEERPEKILNKNSRAKVKRYTNQAATHINFRKSGYYCLFVSGLDAAVDLISWAYLNKKKPDVQHATIKGVEIQYLSACYKSPLEKIIDKK